MRFSIASLAVLLTLAAGSNFAHATPVTVNTNPTWNGTGTIGTIASPNTSTYGEVAQTPAGATTASSFSWYLDAPVGFQVQGFIGLWNPVAEDMTGSMLYLSPVVTTTSTGLRLVTFSNTAVAVTAGSFYVYGLTVDNVFAADNGKGNGFVGWSDTGNSTDYFAWANNSGVASQLNANWNNTGCADSTGACGQAAVTVMFDSAAAAATPEPSSLVLLGTGILGAAGAARRRFVRS